MTLPIQIAYRGIEPSEALDVRVRHHVDKLETLAALSSCRVTVEAPHKPQGRAREYLVHVEMHVPGTTLNVHSHDPRSATDAYASVDDAFMRAARTLVEHARRSA